MPGDSLWCVRAGRRGEADDLFTKKNVVALGWHELGDVTKLAHTREVFRKRGFEVYSNSSPTSARVGADQVYRFVHEFKVGDQVLYPSKISRQIHLGSIQGIATYNPNLSESFPIQREVKWIKSLPRTSFPQAALYEIGSAMTVFRVENYREEILSRFAARSETAVTTTFDADEAAISATADESIETTTDFILKQFSRELKGHPFAALVAHLLNIMGYRTRLSPPGQDRGIDIVAHRDELGLEPPIIKVQVKSGDGKVSAEEVQALTGALASSEFGLFVALGEFTKQARAFGQSKANLRLVESDDLVSMILDHYEQLDARYKRLIP